MAARGAETLLFLVDVQVKGGQALTALKGDMESALGARTQQYETLGQAARNAAEGHSSLADELERVNTAGAQSLGQPSTVTGAGMVSGARSNRLPGSRTNPIVMAQESGEAAGLGSLAAAGTGSSQAGAAAAAAAQNAPSPQPVLDATDLETAVRKGTQAGTAAQDDMVLQGLQQAEAMRRKVGAPSVWDEAAIRAEQAAQVAPSGRTLSSGEVAQQLGVSLAQAREMAATGGLPGARKEAGQWVVPEEALVGAGGSGRGGGRLPPVAYGGSGSGSGGGGWFLGGPGGRPRGSRTLLTATRGLRTEADTGESPFSFANLFKGDQGRGGFMGLPGFGSIGSLGGLGLEHWLLTGLGLTASAGSAIGGAALTGTASLTQAAIGGGSDALVGHAALTNVKAAVPIYQALTAAVKQYGPASKQAAAAQAAWDTEIAKVGPQVAQAAKSYADLKTEFDKDSKDAQQQSAAVMTQALGLAQHYVPLVTSAAQRNLSIINTGLKPLFSWLEGPEGVGIFDTLENKFAQDLPTSIHALDMGLEDFLRLMQAASQYTGGLSRDLDNIFTDKSKESTAQYDEEVQKLVGDLHEWDALLKVLAQDLGGIFRADAGTANSIVVEITQMLEKLHDWENSVTGETDLQNIFSVHKGEILALLKDLDDLARAYGSFYSDVAPPLVNAVTDIAKAFSAVASAIEKIPGGAALLGLVVVMGRLGVLAPSVRALGLALGLVATEEKAVAGGEAAMGGGALLGAGGAARGAAAGGEEDALLAGGAAGGLATRGVTGLARVLGGDTIASGVRTLGVNTALSASEWTGSEAVGDAVATGAASLAPIVGTVVPLAVAALAAYGGDRLLNDLFKSNQPTTSYSASGLTHLLRQKGTGALSMPANKSGVTDNVRAGRGGPLQTVAGPSISTIGPTKQAQATLENFLNTPTSAVSGMNASGLQGLIKEGQGLRGIFSGNTGDVQDLDKALGKLQEDLAPIENAMKLITSRWNADANAGLGTLKGTFAADMKLIASSVGLSSTQGEKMLHGVVQQMVTDLTAGMADGKISVTSGMKEINGVLSTGMTDGATTWREKVTDMLSTLSTLRSKGRITAQGYSTDVGGILTSGAAQVQAGVSAEYSKMAANLKTEMQKGVITAQQGEEQLKGLHQQALSAAANAEEVWLLNLESALQAAGKLTAGEMRSITDMLNHEASVAYSAWQKAGVGGAPSIGPGVGHHAVGGKVTTPMYLAGEEAPQHPEFVLATNPAYRSRNLDLWAQAGHSLGVKGFATGGMSGSWLANASVDPGSQQYLAALSHGAFSGPLSRADLKDVGSQQFFAELNALGAEMTSWLAKMTTAFNNLQTKAGDQSTLASTLQGVNAGTSLRALGLTGAAGKATGLSSKQLSDLIGGGPASYGVLAKLDQQQASEYKSQAAKLEAEYKQAVKLHNTKLEGSLLDQLSAVDSAMTTAISAGQQAIISKIQAQGAAYDATAQNYGSGNSILQTIENLAPGTSLSDLGITPAMAAAMGLPSNYMSLEGTGNTYLQNLLSTNGTLTPAQIASATSGNTALNASLQTEIGGYEQELVYDEGQLPNLSGSAKSTMVQTIIGLIGTISGLQSTMQDNNSALSGLTSATTANTAAVSSSTPVTGTVAYQYQGQQYLASDTVTGLRTGT